MSLTTTFHTITSAGEPPASVRISNLTSTTTLAADAWGRPNKPQPLLISACVSFSKPFDTAASTDQLGDDTVHYGTLSKAILGFVKDAEGGDRSLQGLLGILWRKLTGGRLLGLGVDGDGNGGHGAAEKKPFLSPAALARISFMSITLTLPKASLLGSRVSATASCAFEQQLYGMSFTLDSLRVPTLIGVNDNERLAKQFVITTVTVDKYDSQEDIYVDVERVVVKVCLFYSLSV